MDKGRISVQFFKEFPLGALMLQGIAPFLKTEKGAVRQTCLEVLWAVQHDNPTSRKSYPCVNWLAEYGDTLSKAEYLLILKASTDTTRVCAKHRFEIQLSLLKEVGKHEFQKKWPELWEVCRNDFDRVISQWYAQSRLKNSRRRFFVVANRHALSCFFDVEAALKIDDKKPLENHAKVLQEMLASNIGRHLYKDEGFKDQLGDFEKIVSQRIYDLELAHFAAAEVKKSKTP